MINAVNGISFGVKKGQTFGLVGESGCGKSTVSKLIARLLPADSGEIFFEGEEISRLKGKLLKNLRRKIQIIFQDPLSSLNPRMSIMEILAEPLIIHNLVKKEKIRDAAAKSLEEVGLDPVYLSRFPHQLSGGQRQRVLIARALSLSPDFIVADEPVSALDVSVQAQILNLFMDLRQERNFSSLFISHDLAVVRYVSSRIGVMYLGNLVETGPAEEVFNNPLHPYTRLLVESAPHIGKRKTATMIQGRIPDPLETPTGCVFKPRCPLAEQICSEIIPPLKNKTAYRKVACHLVSEAN